MSSYDKTKVSIAVVTAYLISELQTGLKPKKYLFDNLPKKILDAHLGAVIDGLLENGVIAKEQFENSEFFGYKLSQDYLSGENKFTGNLSKESLARDIAFLGLGNRALNALRADNINTLGELIALDTGNYSWRRVPNLGDKSLKEIRQKLKEIGLNTGYSANH